MIEAILEFFRLNDRPARDLDAAHDAALFADVMDGKVFGGAVVPECHGTWRPTEAAGEFWAVAPGEQPIEQRLGFRLRPAFKADGI